MIIVCKYGYRPAGQYQSSAECTCGQCPPGGTRCAGRILQPREVPAALAAQLRKVWAFRQDLVSAEHAHDTAMKALWSTVPAVAAVEERLAACEEEISGMLATARQSRSVARSVATDKQVAAALRQAQKRARELRAARRSAISAAVRTDPGLVARRDALEAERGKMIDVCRKDHAARGLYWGSSNMALTDHATAVKTVGKRRREGLPARLRHKPHDGTGTVAVSLMRQTGSVSAAERLRVADLAAGGLRPGEIAKALAAEGFAERAPRSVALIIRGLASGKAAGRPVKAPDPPRDPALLASGGGKWRNVFQVSPWMPPEEFSILPKHERRAIARQGLVRFYVGGGEVVEIPVAVHRMLPADADVVEASVTVTRTAGQWDMSVQVTAQVPDPQPVAGPVVALHCGWRSRPDGSVRVGVWASAAPLTPPSAPLTPLMEPHGTWGEIIVPASWMDRAGYPAGVRSIRDVALEPVREKVAAWLDGHPQEGGPFGDRESGVLTGTGMRRWRSPARFAGLARVWGEAPPAGEGGAEIAGLLEEWRMRDRHLWELEANDRDQLSRRRDDGWRKVAAWLCGQAGRLVVDDADLAALRQAPGLEDDDPVLPGFAQARARARAALSAPGRLRSLAVAAATRRGAAVVEVESAFVTRTCPSCGEVGDAHPRYAASAVVTCPACGAVYDQDESAARLLLARANAPAGG